MFVLITSRCRGLEQYEEYTVPALTVKLTLWYSILLHSHFDLVITDRHDISETQITPLPYEHMWTEMVR